MHVEEWANAIECREDIQYISSSLVGEVLHELANPLLTRPLTRQSAAMAIARLNSRVVDLSADVRILDIDAHLVQRQEMYFGTRGASANQIASNIAGDALVMGCTSVRVWTQDDWWLISGNVDWLNAPNHMGVNDQNAFETVWALPEAGQMHHWSTVMARVFATATATRCGENSFLVKGTPADLQQFTRVSANAPHLDRVIGFRFHVAV